MDIERRRLWKRREVRAKGHSEAASEGGEWGCIHIACRSRERRQAIWVKDIQRDGGRAEQRTERLQCSAGVA